MSSAPRPLRARSRVGKYRVQGLISEGGFARVYRAHDTIEDLPVALKVPSEHPLSKDALRDLQREIRLNAKLDHPNILPIRNADIIDGRLIIAYPLGIESLADRMSRRMGLPRVLDFGEQLLEALAHAHERRIAHCDVKPDNIILFKGHRLRLGDFGLARIALKTVVASGSGTLGYMAPEQAMGRPSVRSDVFAVGLILHRLFTGQLPEWPFEWPLQGHAALERKATPGMIALIRRSLRVNQYRRFPDAQEMLARYRRLLPAARRRVPQRTLRRRK
jgi:serine/threonine-protein kinase